MKTTKETVYDLYVRYNDTTLKRLTGYPMSHAECCIMRSKFSNWSQARIELIEAPREIVDTDHGPINNQEAVSAQESHEAQHELLDALIRIEEAYDAAVRPMPTGVMQAIVAARPLIAKAKEKPRSH